MSDDELEELRRRIRREALHREFAQWRAERERERAEARRLRLETYGMLDESAD